jgi:hypothetical protein
VRKTQPAAYLKICASLVPKELKVEHLSGVKGLSDEELERGIEALREMLAAGEAAKVIEGEVGRGFGAADAGDAHAGIVKLRSASSQTATCSGRNSRRRIASGSNESASRPSPRSVPPKVLEAGGRHLRIPDRVLDVLVPEVVLQGTPAQAIQPTA